MEDLKKNNLKVLLIPVATKTLLYLTPSQAKDNCLLALKH